MEACAMNDMSSVITPRSDQYNAEDFVAGPRTFCIEAVSINPGSEQPVAIKLQGEERVWRPCKSMSRCLVAAWGADASVYAGRNITLYSDPTVKWGGMAVGGIRVSHLSHIQREMVMALTETKGKRKPFTVKPLVIAPAAPEPTKPKRTVVDQFRAKIAGLKDRAECVALLTSGTKAKETFDQQSEDDQDTIRGMLADKMGSFLAGPSEPEMDDPPPAEDMFPGDLPSAQA